MKKVIEKELTTKLIQYLNPLVRLNAKYLNRFIRITIESLDSRSLQYNAYYWGVVLKAIESESGYKATELHEYFKYQMAQIFFRNFGTWFELPTITIDNHIEKLAQKDKLLLDLSHKFTTTIYTTQQFNELVGLAKEFGENYGLVFNEKI